MRMAWRVEQRIRIICNCHTNSMRSESSIPLAIIIIGEILYAMIFPMGQWPDFARCTYLKGAVATQ